MKNDKKNIVVFGAGYVGIAVAITLYPENNVILYDVNKAKVKLMSSGISPINDCDMQLFFENVTKDNAGFKITDTLDEGIENIQFAVIAVPTDWNEQKCKLDISILCDVLEKIRAQNKDIIVIIKSTLPIGSMDYIYSKYSDMKVVYVPEFLREGTAVDDEKHLSRLVIGSNKECRRYAYDVEELFIKTQSNPNLSVLHMGGNEAELVKLYSNAYLAMRVSFFNELDTYAEMKHLNTKSIIDGVSLDPRIGNYYNIPSFGYGGYCLPKDTKEIAMLYESIPATVMPAIVKSNQTRKRYIATKIIEVIEGKNLKNPLIGIYRLAMKRNSDNCRDSAIFDIVSTLQNQGYSLVIYETSITELPELNVLYTTDLESFKRTCDLIIANRIDPDIKDVLEKVYTRDIYI